ncbi:MAG TPA: PEP-CTERM sorting domain-containing protein [Terriglobia bacterium]|nr:PEP-CTERM sorting domain-containing protein [Terriglobia bacterium]
MKAYRYVLAAALLAFGFILPANVFADNNPTGYSVLVGYADNLRVSGFFPNPWDGSSGVTNFLGSPPGSQFDAGAIQIDNTSGAPLVITSTLVDINGTSLSDIWGSFTIPIGGIAILTQNNGFNFDTSDVHPISSCGVPVAPGTTPFPTVTITANGVPTTFNDSGHVLDTSGYDFACTGANESFSWRPIGTTGGQGGAPEPASILLLGSGLASLGGYLRRKRART